jgi:hypothetical protein
MTLDFINENPISLNMSMLLNTCNINVNNSGVVIDINIPEVIIWMDFHARRIFSSKRVLIIWDFIL